MKSFKKKTNNSLAESILYQYCRKRFNIIFVIICTCMWKKRYLLFRCPIYFFLKQNRWQIKLEKCFFFSYRFFSKCLNIFFESLNNIPLALLVLFAWYLSITISIGISEYRFIVISTNNTLMDKEVYLSFNSNCIVK